MSAKSGDLFPSSQKDKSEPDFFGFYTTEVLNLLSLDLEDLPGGSKINGMNKEGNGSIGTAPLFSNGLGALLPEFKIERLKILLRQSVYSLTQEVDEIVNPVRSLCRIRSCLKYKEESLSSGDAGEHVNKKPRIASSSSDSEVEGNMPLNARRPSNNGVKECTICHATETPQWRPAPDGTKSLCNACGLRLRKQQKKGLNLSPNSVAEKNDIEVDGDLHAIVKNDSTKVEELMKHHSTELLAKLEHMEKGLEKLLNLTMDSCRPMTISELQKLRKSIQNLPSKNLARVVEIIQRDKQLDSSEVYVDLADLDKITLWRLYFYVALVETIPPENTSTEEEA